MTTRTLLVVGLCLVTAVGCVLLLSQNGRYQIHGSLVVDSRTGECWMILATEKYPVKEPRIR
jgi:hypothetical protein